MMSKNYKKKVWIASLSHTSKDPRPYRLIEYLCDKKMNVATLASPQKQIRNATIPKKVSSYIFLLACGLLFRLRICRSWSCRRYITSRYPDVKLHLQDVQSNDIIIIFDLDLLALISPVLKKSRAVLDLREIYTEQFGHKSVMFQLFLRPMRIYLLNKNVECVTEFLTVSTGLQAFYSKNFEIQARLLRSVPKFSQDKSNTNVGTPIRSVYMGVAHPLRRIEVMIDAISNTSSNIELHLYLVGDSKYIDFLQQYSRNRLTVHFHKPVEFLDIHKTLIGYDLGWSYFQPTTTNLELALPNKFFEYVQAGLGVIHGPNLDMMRESTEWGFGFFSNDYSFQNLCRLLDSLSEATVVEAKRSARIASQFLHFGRESDVIDELFERLDLST